jgi:hypothetical protein
MGIIYSLLSLFKRQSGVRETSEAVKDAQREMLTFINTMRIRHMDDSAVLLFVNFIEKRVASIGQQTISMLNQAPREELVQIACVVYHNYKVTYKKAGEQLVLSVWVGYIDANTASSILNKRDRLYAFLSLHVQSLKGSEIVKIVRSSEKKTSPEVGYYTYVESPKHLPV